MTVPFVAFGNEELARCVGAPDEGGMVACARCGGEHAIRWSGDEAQKARKTLGTVECGGKSYLAAVDGKLVGMPAKAAGEHDVHASPESTRRHVRVFAPLPADHPLVRDGALCWICRRRFAEGARVVLLPSETGKECVAAEPTHATCALRGEPCAKGIVLTIHDGGASGPVVTTDGQSWTFAEAGIDGE